MFNKKQIEFEQVVTRTGDKGESGLYSGERLRKDDIIFEALGHLDELNAYLGVSKLGLIMTSREYQYVSKVQVDLLTLSSEIATQPSFSEETKKPKNNWEEKIKNMEKEIQNNLKVTPIPSYFIIGGQNGMISAHFDYSRTICRRAERSIVSIIRDKERIDLFDIQKYVNRLSDYLYVVARALGV